MMLMLRRLLRKRWVLGVVFGLSLIYFLTSTLKQVHTLHLRKMGLPSAEVRGRFGRDVQSWPHLLVTIQVKMYKKL